MSDVFNLNKQRNKTKKYCCYFFSDIKTKQKEKIHNVLITNMFVRIEYYFLATVEICKNHIFTGFENFCRI